MKPRIARIFADYQKLYCYGIAVIASEAKQ